MREFGSDKRFCTLQITICAEPSQQNVKLELIFNLGGERRSEEERSCYDSLQNVVVRFQENAWADERVAMQYLETFRESTLHQGEVLLGMDNHGAQSTALCREFMAHMGIVPAYTPANCTDCVSPVDKNVAETLKKLIRKKYSSEFALHRDEWNVGLPESEKRQKVALWASEAWTEFCRDHQDCIKSAFVKTGFLLAKDGSENSKVCLWTENGRATNVAPDGTPYWF